jgi:hypothetical protein
VWDGCSAAHLKTLNSLHRRAVKLITTQTFEQTDDLFQQFKLLPLTKRFLFNKAKFIHKIIFNNAPPYLSPLFTSQTRHSERLNILKIPFARIDLFMKSLCYSGRHFWNSLPSTLKEIESPYCFNKQMLLYLNSNTYKPP